VGYFTLKKDKKKEEKIEEKPVKKSIIGRLFGVRCN